MTNITTLVPSSVALSRDAAIEAILSDIPLFCEGIMGIGVFTFLFLTKQVNILAIFLYGSTFLAFAAATLDLGQVLARGPQDTAAGIGLDTVAGFIYAREIFLSLALGSLDLFFWRLVAHCPRGENPPDSTISTGSSRKTMHSASWGQWGVVGVVLKWGSLVSVLAVPLLQIIWRTMPGQRKYGSVYVAETVIQTAVTFTFVLKLLLNVYISPRAWGHAFKSNSIPVGALLIGGGIGIGNIAIFAFTESSLGRFLRAVEVYILIVHSLYTTFLSATSIRSSAEVYSPGSPFPEKAAPVDLGTEKFQGELPFAYTRSDVNANYNTSSQLQVTRRPDNSSRAPIVTWILPRRTSSVPVIPRQEVRTSTTPSIDVVVVSPLSSGTRSRTEVRVDIPRPPSFVDKMDSPKIDRPFTPMTLSYYSMEDATKSKQSAPPSPMSLVPANRQQNPSGTSSNVASQQGSISSLDEILRQQNELDQTIAALRLRSRPTEELSPDLSKQSMAESRTKLPGQSRSTLNSSKTESLSNHSEFSLSIFPTPPFNESTVATGETGNHDVDALPDSALLRSSSLRRKNVPPITVPSYQSTSKVELSQNNATLVDPGPSSSRKDATPPNPALTVPGNGSQVMSSTEEVISDSDGISDIGNATIGSAIVLRPMILASLIINSPEEGRSSGNYFVNQSNRDLTPSTSGLEPSNVPNLRPLYLGKKPISSIPMISRPVVMPLAQRRRQRSRAVTNNQRPVISPPRLNSVTEAAPGAFERPRPPPQRR